jgi:hypothetical protein
MLTSTHQFLTHLSTHQIVLYVEMFILRKKSFVPSNAYILKRGSTNIIIGYKRTYALLNQRTRGKLDVQSSYHPIMPFIAINKDLCLTGPK